MFVVNALFSLRSKFHKINLTFYHTIKKEKNNKTHLQNIKILIVTNRFFVRKYSRSFAAASLLEGEQNTTYIPNKM